MAIEKHFIEENVKKLIIRKFTEEELSKVGCGEVSIYRTPLGMRISIYAEKPGLIIGRKGKTIHSLTETFVRDFKLENPQLEVQQIERPELNATLMAQKIASSLERGIHFRRAVYGTMKRVMSAGALGCEVTVSGKVTGERARMTKFVEGFIKHAGDQKNDYIQEGYAQALLKPGVLGVQVTIVPPDANLKEITYLTEEPAQLTPLAAEEKPEEGKSAEGKPAAGKPEAQKPQAEKAGTESPKTETAKPEIPKADKPEKEEKPGEKATSKAKKAAQKKKPEKKAPKKEKKGLKEKVAEAKKGKPKKAKEKEAGKKGTEKKGTKAEEPITGDKDADTQG